MLTRFYLGTHMPHWLTKPEVQNVPLFVSRIRLQRYRKLQPALTDWALDSGGFSQLSTVGHWTITAKQYVAEVRRYADEIGRLQWAACMDWMTEPFILERTGLTVADHQLKTTENFLELRDLAPGLPWVPVLQGWTGADYLRHVDLYADRGVDLRQLQLVGIGSVCRRQHTDEAEEIIRRIASMGIPLHGFGFKLQGLLKVATALRSADSLAWSYAARRRQLPEHVGRHKTCANCLEYALRWRLEVLRQIEASGEQSDLFNVSDHFVDVDGMVPPAVTHGP